MKIGIRLKSPSPSESLTIQRTAVGLVSRPMRVLDFDIENRPLSYLGSDFTTAEVTAVAWAWTDHPADVTCYLLGEVELSDILAAFLVAYNQADMITGHYIRGHDLPMINGALLELGQSPLPDKLVQDTKLDLMRSKGLSLSQESLAAMMGLEHPKQSMNQAQWRAANRLTAEGLAEVRRRVIGDVQQHIELRAKLVSRGYLAAPTIWKSGVSQSNVEYTP